MALNKLCDITRLMKFEATNKTMPRNLAPSRGLYPSGQFIKVGTVPYGKCPRSVYYQNTGAPSTDEINYRLQGMAHMGNLIEDMVIGFVKKTGTYIDDQYQMVDTENFWSGKVDILTHEFSFDNGFKSIEDITVDREKIIPIELKTVYGYYGTKGVIKFNSKTLPSPKHNAVMQLALYVDFLQRKGFNTPYGVIWYVSRDEGESMSYKLTIEHTKINGVDVRQIYIDDKSYKGFTIEGILKHNLLTKDAIDRGIAPPREYSYQYNEERLKRMAANGDLSKDFTAKVEKDRFVDKGDVECRYCDFSEHCYRNVGNDLQDIQQKLYTDIDNALWENMND